MEAMPPSLGVEYPLYLEVKVRMQSELKRKRTMVESREEKQHDPHQHAARLSRASGSGEQAKRGAGESHGGAGESNRNKKTHGNDFDDEAVKQTTLAAKKAHSAWDRCLRDNTSNVQKAKGHKNTRDTQLLRDLEDMLTSGKDVDAKVLRFEQAVGADEAVTSQEVGQALADVTELDSIINQCRKKANAIKGLWTA